MLCCEGMAAREAIQARLVDQYNRHECVKTQQKGETNYLSGWPSQGTHKMDQVTREALDIHTTNAMPFVF